MAYQVPGVYIEEKPGARGLEAVGTSVAAFVGIAPDASRRVNEAVLITNWSQFQREFCPRDPDAVPESTPLAIGVYGFFYNGGSACFVVNMADTKSLTGRANKREGLRVLETVAGVSIVAAPGFCDQASHQALLEHAAEFNRFAILDPPPAKAAPKEGAAPEIIDLTLLTRAAVEGDPDGGLRPPFYAGGHGAFYFPRILITDPFRPGTKPIAVGPSGHLAGLFARTDRMRGVHKAPANDTVRGALGPEISVTKGEQMLLNPKGVNVIRAFPNSPASVWGARTVDESSSEFRYVPVRRTMNMIKESIELGTRWVVFEPNDETLWRSIKRDVSAFLTGLWRSGALRGATPEQAFFVKCDAETNPPDGIDRGEVVTEIGVSIVKPAEFIIFRIGQSVESAASEPEGGEGGGGGE